MLAAAPAIGALELLQLWVPGRHARLEDFVVNLVTFWVAFAVVSAGLMLVEFARTRPAPSQGS